LIAGRVAAALRASGLSLALVMLLPAGGVEAQTAPESYSKVTRQKIAPDQRRGAYWSKARMRDAKPFPLPQVDPMTLKSLPKRVSRPAAPTLGKSKDPRPPRARASGNVRVSPLKWAGKLLFTTPKGNSYCSAQFVAEQVILTAAHCVQDKDTGEFNTNFRYLLQYNSGKHRARYDAECVFTLEGWVADKGNPWRWDFALVRVDRPSDIGSMGWHYDWPMDLYSDAGRIGYPLGIRRGEVIQVERGPIFVDSGLVEMRHGNAKNTNGSSGGAVIGSYQPDGAETDNMALSVMSFFYPGKAEVSFGPYFDGDFIGLLEAAEGGC
jgi:hypothetical protein